MEPGGEGVAAKVEVGVLAHVGINSLLDGHVASCKEADLDQVGCVVDDVAVEVLGDDRVNGGDDGEDEGGHGETGSADKSM